MRNLDEEIRYCEEVAEEKECIAHSLTKDGWQEHFNNLTQEKEAEYKNIREEMANGCLECAKEYRQLAEWLKELKAYREAREEIIRKRDSSQWSELVVHGFSHAIYTIDNHLKEVNADDRN